MGDDAHERAQQRDERVHVVRPTAVLSSARIMDQPSAAPVELIATPEALAAFCARIAEARYLAVDTEFVRERTYYPRLCLVQIASESILGCVDTLAIDDLSPLTALLQTPTITKVLHAGRQDLEIFTALAGAVPGPVYDTQIAADLCGHGNQVGLAAVAEELLDVRLDKQHARADWSKRPLRAALLRYAADDVRYLVPIYARLQERLQELNRVAWLAEDCARLADPSLYSVDPTQAWQRVSGIRNLDGPRFHAARLLADWRERRAMRLDRPRGWVLRDEALMALAQALPDNQRELERVDALPPALRRKAADELLAIFASARASDAPVPDKPEPLTPEQKQLVATAMQAVRDVAKTLNISSATLATRREVTRIVRGANESPALEGWRRQVIGERLLEISARA